MMKLVLKRWHLQCGKMPPTGRFLVQTRTTAAPSLLRQRALEKHVSNHHWMTTTISSSPSTTPKISLPKVIWREVYTRPIEFLSIPCVAAFVGILTNWMGVKMLFYPIEYMGINWKRWEDTPYGILGWQG